MQSDLPPLPRTLNPQVALRINRKRGRAQLLRLMAEQIEAEADEQLAVTVLSDDREDAS